MNDACSINDTVGQLAGLRTLPVSAAILNRGGTIVEVNDLWKDHGRDAGLRTPNFGVGSYYLAFCDWSDDSSLRLRRELHALLDGERDHLTHAYACHSPDARRWFVMFGVPLAHTPRTGAALFHIDVTTWLPKLSAQDAGSVAWDAPAARSLLFGAIAGAGSVADRTPIEADAQVRVGRLSPRQRDVFLLVGQGRTNQQIAEALSLSLHTVKLHVSAILRKLELGSRTQIAVLAARLGAGRPGRAEAGR
jgi:DNA-binding CsgD family transcriptional regulator